MRLESSVEEGRDSLAWANHVIDIDHAEGAKGGLMGRHVKRCMTLNGRRLNLTWDDREQPQDSLLRETGGE